MMAGKKPDYRVYISRTGANKESFFTEIGAAWNVAKDGISVQLHTVPLDGRCVLFPYREKQSDD